MPETFGVLLKVTVSIGGIVLKRSLVSMFAVAVLLLSGCATQPQQLAAQESAATQAEPIQDLEPIQDWSLEFTREQLMEQALDVAHNFFDANIGTDVSAQYFFEDSVSATRVKKYKELTQVSLDIFSDYAYGETVVIAGKTQAFMTGTILENDITIPPQVVKGTNSLCSMDMWEVEPSGCNWDQTVWYGFGQVEELEYATLHNVAPHEIFHSVQNQLAGGTMGMLQLPIWLVEGSAEYIGYAVTDYTGRYKYEDLAYADYHYLPNPATGIEFWAQPIRISGIPAEWYQIGQIASEYIVANVGMEGLLKIFENTGLGMDPDQAFEDAIGMPLKKFNVLFDMAYTKMMTKDTGEFRTFENRLCPEKYGWDCSVDNYRNLEWWHLMPTPVDKPSEAENSDHGREYDPFMTDFTLPNCERLEGEIGIPLAITFTVAEQFDIPGTEVSTEWYVRQSHLDTNADGLACGPGDVLEGWYAEQR